MVANPIRMSATPPAYERPPPTLGQHSAEVLRELAGVDAAELERLRAAGVV
jgi:crotonobetainyl-CoA:carnitine CoA-transferase CaiB-like acyl-CoA transferase